ncbi:MAG: methyl-accepting chemotaxis protein [Clostridiales bacterium]
MKKISFKIAILAIVSNFIILIILGLFSFYLISESNKSRVNDMENELRSSFDRLIKTQVENVISLLDEYDKKVEKGEMSLKDAKKEAADIIRELRYGEDGYFWADTLEGVNVVLLGNDSEGKNRYNLKDVKGYPLIQEIIKNGQKEGGGFTDYHFPKANTTEPLPKRGYSLEFKPFKWIIGTGNYTNDIDKLVSIEKEKINERYKKALIILIIATIISMTISSFIAISVSNKISKPIILVSDYLRILSNGDLSTDYDFKDYQKNKDETSILISSLMKMKKSLYKMIYDISNQSARVYSMSNNARTKIEKLKESINNISGSTEQLSASMEETAASTEELNAISLDIQNFSLNVAKKVKSGVLNSKEIHHKYEKAKELLARMGISRNKSTNEDKSRILEILEAMENEINTNLKYYHEFIQDLSSSTHNLNENIEATVTSIGQLGETNAQSASEILEIAKNTSEILKEANTVLELSKDSRNSSLTLMESIKKFELDK